MRIALISYDFGEYCTRLASALAQTEEVLLFLPQGEAGPYAHLLHPTVSLEPFSKPRLRQPILQVRSISAILRTVHTFSPHLVHFQHSHLWFNFALRYLKRYPLVLTVHDPVVHPGDRASAKIPQWVRAHGYHQGDEFIVHAESIKELCGKRLSIPAQSLHIVPHIRIGEEPEDTRGQEEPFCILFFGRIWEYKGLEYLIKAEPLISEHVPEVKIIIAGQGEDFTRYQNMMVHPDRFAVYNEYISDEKRAELFQRASIVVLPYIEASQSGVIPIAYTFAKPVIATAVGGLPEAVDHGQTGYLVPPRDERALARAIIRLLQDSSLRQRMGLRGKKKLEAESGPEVVAQKTLAVYEKALHDHG